MAAKRRYQKCAVKHCGINLENQPHMQFFGFPRSDADCSSWIMKINNPGLSDCSFCFIRNNYTVCVRHFERRCFQTEEQKKLNRNAVPTLHLKPESSEIEEGESNEQETTPKKRRKVACGTSTSNLSSTSADYSVQVVFDNYLKTHGPNLSKINK